MGEHRDAKPISRPNAECDVPEQSAEWLLVVEDDPYLRRVLVRTLQHWGFVIREAPDGGTAVDQILASGDDLGLVLLDIMLPVLDGVEVARIVRPNRPDLPIVACSAAMNGEIEAQLREIGVRHFLPKPYTAESLRESLRCALSQ